MLHETGSWLFSFVVLTVFGGGVYSSTASAPAYAVQETGAQAGTTERCRCQQGCCWQRQLAGLPLASSHWSCGRRRSSSVTQVVTM